MDLDFISMCMLDSACLCNARINGVAILATISKFEIKMPVFALKHKPIRPVCACTIHEEQYTTAVLLSAALATSVATCLLS